MNSKNFQKFYDQAIRDLEKNNIKVSILNRKQIKLQGHGYCIGYFDEQTLAVAMKNELSAETFVHEYCHFLQYKENFHLWKKIQKDDIFTRLEKKKFGIKDWETTYNTIALERDCENRAIKISAKYKLFDNNLYAKMANAYLYYYHFVFLNKSWISSTGIYDAEIIAQMPSKLIPASKFKKIDMDIMMLYNKILKS